MKIYIIYTQKWNVLFILKPFFTKKDQKHCRCVRFVLKTRSVWLAVSEDLHYITYIFVIMQYMVCVRAYINLYDWSSHMDYKNDSYILFYWIMYYYKIWFLFLWNFKYVAWLFMYVTKQINVLVTVTLLKTNSDGISEFEN